MKKFTLTLCLVLTAVLVLPSVASAKTPTLKSLAKTVAALQKKVSAQATTIAGQGTKITALSSNQTTAKQTITALQTTVAAHTTTLTSAAPLLAIAPYVSLNAGAMNGVVGPNVVFKGCNVHVMSKTSETDASGTGNLIVGWDDLRPAPLPSPWRTGSNNLVAGNEQNFTSLGGFVAGDWNSVSGWYSSVGGGAQNAAEGAYTSVSGGFQGRAISWGAAIGGGSGVSLNSGTSYAWQAGTLKSPP